MVVAIGLGIGVSMTMLSVYTSDGGRSDSRQERPCCTPCSSTAGAPTEPFDEPNEPPLQLTWRDAIALAERSPEGLQRTATVGTGFVVEVPGADDVRPEIVSAGRPRRTSSSCSRCRSCTARAGAPRAMRTPRRSIVLSRSLNEKLFGGEDSVGRDVRVGDRTSYASSA